MQKRSFYIKSKAGYSPIEAILTLGLFGVLVIGGMKLVSLYSSAVLSSIALGEKEDLRRFVRRSFNCEKMNETLKNICPQGASKLISRVYDRSCNEIQGPYKAASGDKYQIKPSCTKDGDGYLVNFQYTNLKNSKTNELIDLFDVPLRCNNLTPVSIDVPMWSFGRNKAGSNNSNNPAFEFSSSLTFNVKDYYSDPIERLRFNFIFGQSVINAGANSILDSLYPNQNQIDSNNGDPQPVNCLYSVYSHPIHSLWS